MGVLSISRDKMTLKQWTEAAVVGDEDDVKNVKTAANVLTAGSEEAPKYIMGFKLVTDDG